MRIAWVCDNCNWLLVSDSKLRHEMDYCKCKKTACDLEEGYCRWVGKPRIIAICKDGKKWRVKYGKK